MGKHRATVRIGGDGVDEFIQFERGVAKFLGAGGDDFLMGAKGDDYLDGGTGNDRIAGGSGTDRVKGGEGNDIVDGNKGDDKLTGGPGDDIFLFGPGFGRDKVTDFQRGYDHFDFIETLREDGSVRLQFSDIKISYDHQSHEAIIRVPGQGRIEVLHFDGTLQESDFHL